MNTQRFSLSLFVVLLVLTVSLSSCDLVAGIFEAGVWAGVLLVVGGIALVIWFFSRIFKR